jgi:hypothetical protein
MHLAGSKTLCPALLEEPQQTRFDVYTTSEVLRSGNCRGAGWDDVAGYKLSTSPGNGSPAKRSHKYPRP